METINIPVSEIKPYALNAKKHPKEQVENIAESLKQFGWVQPIVLDAGNEIVIGHGRFEAAKRLHLKEVPCLYVNDLSEDDVKKLRLLDNKLNESDWDFDFLGEDLKGLDFSGWDIDWGLDFEEQEEESDEEDEEEKENAREATINAYNLMEYDEGAVEGFYQMPVIEPVNYVPDGLMGFNYALSAKQYDNGIHFYVDDYQFERVWNRPQDYLDILKRFPCMLTPDFSLYTEMPIAMKVWNIYRSRLIGQIAQREGMIVIPTVSWCEEATFTFCFDGLPKHSTLSISTIGVKRGDENFKLWENGVKEMIKRLQPRRLLVYGGKVDYDYGNIEVVYYENGVTERMKNSRK